MSDSWDVPKLVFADTSVVMRALGAVDDERSGLCAEFFDELEKASSRIVISALTIAEMRRRRSRKAYWQLPRVGSLVVVPFVAEDAHVCGDLFPWPEAGAPIDDDTLGGARTKFDIMIVAAALRLSRERGGDGLVFSTLDGNQQRKAEKAGLSVGHPNDYRPSQQSLKLEEPERSRPPRKIRL